MMSKCVVIMVTVLCTVSARTSKLNTRIDIVERRVTTVSMETALMKQEMTQVLDNLFELNQTVLESAGECARCDNNHEQEKVYADDGVHKVAMEALEGFKNEKRWVRDEISKLQHTIMECNKRQLDTEDRLTGLMKEFEKQNNHLKEPLKSLPQSVSPCPDDWKSYGKFCYQFFPDAVTFNDARTECAKVGASVVDIQDMTEMNFVSNLDGGVNGFWIGLTDQEQEGIYKWERTNSEAQFTNWAPGEPDEGSQQDCVGSIGPSYDPPYTWFDILCYEKGPFVCKKPRQHI